jgi:hypothetical protein
MILTSFRKMENAKAEVDAKNHFFLLEPFWAHLDSKFPKSGYDKKLIFVEKNKI